jgi:3-phosphoshikimate 1-carboxyvinyltransferase
MLSILKYGKRWSALVAQINPHIKIATYNDLEWRGICSLALKVPIIIENAVVSKSYPDFWEDLKI